VRIDHRLRGVLVALLVFILLVLLLPLALVGPGFGDIDADRITATAALYGVTSTILSALALCGVALSIHFQAQANRSSAHIAAREQHASLLKQSMDDAELRACWSSANLPGEGPSERQLAYTNLIFCFWELQWEIGIFSDEYVSSHSAITFKESVIARRYWKRARIARTECGCDRSQFYRLIDSQYELLPPEQTPPSPSSARVV
jgi:hypothetical protein